jgi:hypothetical protein
VKKLPNPAGFEEWIDEVLKQIAITLDIPQDLLKERYGEDQKERESRK